MLRRMLLLLGALRLLQGCTMHHLRPLVLI
jgi:hypothetical protein